MPDQTNSIRRRSLLTGLCGLSVAAGRLGRAQDGGEDPMAPPREGDRLVFAFGDREGQVVEPEDLVIGSRQIFAHAMHPESQVIRNYRLNQVVLVRLNPAWLSEETLGRSADGIVAYSGVCTHTGCDVDLWNAEVNRFQCPCHESQFDPADSARVVGGPAPWQLAALPLKLVDDRLTVAGEFIGRVGFQQPGLDPFGI
jgi:rieske iron-sulfur protein